MSEAGWPLISHATESLPTEVWMPRVLGLGSRFGLGLGLGFGLGLGLRLGLGLG